MLCSQALIPKRQAESYPWEKQKGLKKELYSNHQMFINTYSAKGTLLCPKKTQRNIK